jgi:TonB family protein
MRGAGLLFLLVLAATPALAGDMPSCTDPGIIMPKPANKHGLPSDSYPLLSVVLGEQGNVTLAIVIAPDGKVADVKVEKSSGFARLDDAAVAAVKSGWLYTPAVKDGQAIACRWRTTVAWAMRGNGFDMGGMEKSLINIVRMKPDDFPPAALTAHEQGVTGLLVAVDENGKVAQTKVLHSSGFPDLDAAAESIARDKWSASPGRLTGKTFKTAFVVAVVWALDTGQ